MFRPPGKHHIFSLYAANNVFNQSKYKYQISVSSIRIQTINIIKTNAFYNKPLSDNKLSILKTETHFNYYYQKGK